MPIPLLWGWPFQLYLFLSSFLAGPTLPSGLGGFMFTGDQFLAFPWLIPFLAPSRNL